MNEVPQTPTALALWRYGLISPLLHRDPAGRTLQDVLDDLARSDYLYPDGRIRRLSPETLRKWLSRFRVGGLGALEDQSRSDKGSTEVPEPILDRIRALREDHPRWTLSVLFRRLAIEGVWNGAKPSVAALYRYCRGAGMERKPAVGADCRSFAFDNFGSLWIADFLHGPRLSIRGQKRKTYLHVIIDDATRFVVGAGVFLNEDVEVLISELKYAIRCHGIPQRFYTDNGAAYRSRHLRIVGARLAMQMPHTPPYRPQGRGKIERFFRTLREQFLAVTEANTLDALRQDLHQWLATYHESRHDSLDCSPLQKRVTTASVCRQFPETAIIEPLFFMEKRCRVYHDGTVRLHRMIFEVPGCEPGGRVLVFYDPTNAHRVWYGDPLRLARKLDRSENANRFHHPPARKERP